MKDPIVQESDGSYTLYVPQGRALKFNVSVAGELITAADSHVRADIDNPAIALDIGPHITIVGGVAEVNVPGATTAALVDWGAGVWDFEIVVDGDVLTAMSGRAYLKKEVTRG